MQMITRGYYPLSTPYDYYSDSSFDRSGGGLLGGLVVFAVGKAFGTYGVYAVSVIGMIITLCIATQRPLFSLAAERGFSAKKKIDELRERSLERSAFLPYDDEEFDEEYDEDLDDEEEEIRPFRRSGKKGPSVPRQQKTESGRSSRDTSGRTGRGSLSDLTFETAEDGQQVFSDSFLFALDRREEEREAEEKLSMDEAIQNAKKNRKIDEAVREMSENILKPFRKNEDPAESVESWNDAAPEITINQSSGAAAMELEQTAAEQTEAPERHKKEKTYLAKDELAKGVESIAEEIQEKEEKLKEKPYELPPLTLLKKGSGIARGDSNKYLKETAAALEQVLHDFGVNAHVVDASSGPSVTRYEVKPEQGVKVSKIVNLSDDIMMHLAASNIRIEAPIPGKAAVGIEVPNKTVASVLLRDLLESPEFINHPSKIAFAVGKDIAGKTVVTDIARMPHLLIAGATGSGKSVCINTLIMSILYKASPDEVKLLMIDPKVVELSVYNGIPHLAIPVVTDPKKAAGALNWAVAEMTDRYNKFAEYGVRDVSGFNAKVDGLTDVPEEQKPKKMPQIVIVVDELADLMMVAPGEVEDAICRLAQLARAAGIHLIIATQRPSVNVVTGLIKANMPSRIALSVASGVDSRTILDMNGAEKLLGHGDMLFYPQGYTQPARVQGGYISDDEIAAVVQHLSEAHGEVTYDASIEAKINSASTGGSASKGNAGGADQDELVVDAARLIIDKDKASIGMFQRQFKIGFNRAARIMDQLCEAGVVGPEEGTKPRKILMSKEQFENYLEEGRL